MNKNRLAITLAGVLALAGCATFQNTPKQEYVLACMEACKSQIPPQCRVTRVDPRGPKGSRP